MSKNDAARESEREKEKKKILLIARIINHSPFVRPTKLVPGISIDLGTGQKEIGKSKRFRIINRILRIDGTYHITKTIITTDK